MYELIFWNYQEGIYLNHHEVYESLIDDKIVDGLEEIQQQVILNRITSVFKNWDKIDDNSWKNPKGKGAFQVKSSNQFILIDCYGTEGKTMDLLVNTLEEFHLPLYDPQIPVRYDDFNE
jgi:hypothetical protein